MIFWIIVGIIHILLIWYVFRVKKSIKERMTLSELLLTVMVPIIGPITEVINLAVKEVKKDEIKAILKDEDNDKE